LSSICKRSAPPPRRRRAFDRSLALAFVCCVATAGVGSTARAATPTPRPAPTPLAPATTLASPDLDAIVKSGVRSATKVAIAGGQDVIPFSLEEKAANTKLVLATYAQDAQVTQGRLAAFAYDSSIRDGFRALARKNDWLAVLVYSSHLRLGTADKTALVLEAYQRGDPVTFRYAQPYRIDSEAHSGKLDGPLLRLPDGPPHFSAGR
jgi:peptidoglycan hydrolase-like protein with peptidoglycan-binding domain